MKHRAHRGAAVALLAVCAALSASTASAATTLVVRSAPQPPAYVLQGPPVYAYEGREYDHFAHRHCAAQRWDPNARYAPGQAVWRNGRLYVATEESAHVWNVNSPPEWTPNYWAPARCR
jgi:hypothetical protein